jgi:cell fate regulator YaaT (PSP1 superfamily)
LKKDDRIVVEADGGHDLGTVTLTGDLAEKQFRQKEPSGEKDTLKKVYRKATQADLENWLNSKRRERDVLLEARRLAGEMSLSMSIGDVEFQGDGRRVTIYYTAENRVDFRELVKRYASAFMAKIEMRQIGARQEAAKIGGLGSCGRELCCSTWKTGMNSVRTDAARTQNLSLVTSKLAGQCGKLKCCLNYELDSYLEAWEQFPARLIDLESDRGILTPLHPDLLKRTVHYKLADGSDHSRFEIPVEQVKLYISLNRKGKKVETDRIPSTISSVREVQTAFN